MDNNFEEDFTEVKSTTNVFDNASLNDVKNVFDETKNAENKLKAIKKDKKIERIQLMLILILIVVGSLVYFFGYDMFKPFIKID